MSNFTCPDERLAGLIDGYMYARSTPASPVTVHTALRLQIQCCDTNVVLQF